MTEIRDGGEEGVQDEVVLAVEGMDRMLAEGLQAGVLAPGSRVSRPQPGLVKSEPKIEVNP